MKRKWPFLLLTLISTAPVLSAFPPAPPFVLRGIVRDEIGDPFGYAQGEIRLLEGDRVIARGQIRDDVWREGNFRLAVPMDAQRKAERYKPTAMEPYSRVTVEVVVNGYVYLPLEVRGNGLLLGGAGESAYVELTLGQDLDEDGLPDTWEAFQLYAVGIYEGDERYHLGTLQPGDDIDGDGLDNYTEYLAGTYALDGASAFSLEMLEKRDGEATLEFLAIIGRKYELERLSMDSGLWEKVSFTPKGEATPVQTWLAPGVQYQQIRSTTHLEGPTFYRLSVK
jgi:hypothetical protein